MMTLVSTIAADVPGLAPLLSEELLRGTVAPGSPAPHACLAFLSMPGGWEWLLIAIVALLLFGKRLPDVARSFGKSIVEFKKGIRDVQDDLNTNNTSRTNALPSDRNSPGSESKDAGIGSSKP